MVVTTLQQVLDALPGQPINFLKNMTSGVTNPGIFASTWISAGYPVAASTPPASPGAICDRNTVGAIPIHNAGAGKTLYIAKVSLPAMSIDGMLLLCDRLAHVGGLNGTLTTAQAVANPALTRYTTGAGVEIWLEPYTSTGATTTTITGSYTNSAGVSGRIIPATTIPANMATSRCFPLPLAVGDRGVRSVETVTLAASTGTAGNFGIALVKRLATVRVDSLNPVLRDAISLGLPVVQTDACLMAYYLCSSSSSFPVAPEICLIEG